MPPSRPARACKDDGMLTRMVPAVWGRTGCLPSTPLKLPPSWRPAGSPSSLVGALKLPAVAGRAPASASPASTDRRRVPPGLPLISGQGHCSSSGCTAGRSHAGPFRASANAQACQPRSCAPVGCRDSCAVLLVVSRRCCRQACCTGAAAPSKGSSGHCNLLQGTLALTDSCLLLTAIK